MAKACYRGHPTIRVYEHTTYDPECGLMGPLSYLRGAREEVERLIERMGGWDAALDREWQAHEQRSAARQKGLPRVR